MVMQDQEITPSCGNVFRDLGFDEEEAAHLEVRSTLMFTIRKLIQYRELTQAKAVALLGVTQPRISDLVRGRIDLFSIDGLVDMLARAGIKVDVTVSPMPERGAA
jgi:predicted XRE-type DNA-binding protein